YERRNILSSCFVNDFSAWLVADEQDDVTSEVTFIHNRFKITSRSRCKHTSLHITHGEICTPFVLVTEPMIAASCSYCCNIDNTLSASLSSTTRAMPLPILKSQNISLSGIFPFSCTRSTIT